LKGCAGASEVVSSWGAEEVRKWAVVRGTLLHGDGVGEETPENF